MYSCAAIAIQSGREFLIGSLLYPDALLVRSGLQKIRNGDWAGAEPLFLRALARDPASAYRWSDTGNVFRGLGRKEKARICYLRAAELGRYSPPVLLRVTRALFDLDATEEAFTSGGRLLALTDAYDKEVFRQYDYLRLPATAVYDRGIPRNGRPAGAYFQHLLEREAPLENLRDAWQRATALNGVDDPLANRYVEYLLKQGEHSTAAELWRKHLGSRPGAFERANLLVNGGFEMTPTAGVLDWRVFDCPGVTAIRDSQVAHSGRTSLRINFHGNSNLSYGHVSQTAVVAPGHYRFQAYLRASEITTDEGIGFLIHGNEDASRLHVTTDRITGTAEWIKVEKVFSVTSFTKSLSIKVIRNPSAKFDSDIRGTVWIDTVSLVAAN
ncbi:MAG: carbohydrate binding domain-containing protein [Candidatus Solibacter usitatus]|nr:carbohydrate binding domain-containing protein [Candidatus Solibacter usitatus]